MERYYLSLEFGVKYVPSTLTCHHKSCICYRRRPKNVVSINDVLNSIFIENILQQIFAVKIFCCHVYKYHKVSNVNGLAYFLYPIFLKPMSIQIKTNEIYTPKKNKCALISFKSS